MRSREILLRVLYRGLLDIRLAAKDGNTSVPIKLADLLHNLPLAILTSADDATSDIELQELQRRAEMFGLARWLEVALNDIKSNEK